MTGWDAIYNKAVKGKFKLTAQKAFDEHDLQVRIVNYLRWNHFYVFAIPNGGRRDAATGRKLKDEGVLAGVADLEILLPDGKAVFVELKTPWGVQSDAQKAFENEVKLRGYTYLLWRSAKDAEAFVKSYYKDYDVQTTEAGGLILDANASTFKDY